MPKSGPIKACDLVEAIAQTVTYGQFIVLIIVALLVFLGRGCKSRSNIIILVVTIVAFVLSTGSWVATHATFIVKIVSNPSGDHLGIATAARLNFNAIIFINLLFADGVVVWRMRALCQDHFSRKVLATPLVLLALTSIAVIGTIIVRIYETVLPASALPHEQSLVTNAVNVSQVATLIFSLVTNIVSTSIIARWAWYHWNNSRILGATQSSSIITLLVESGAIYCISSVIALVSYLIRLPIDCTLGDIYSPVQANLAGMYPVLTVLLIGSRSTASVPIRAPEFKYSNNFIPQGIPQTTNTTLSSLRFRDVQSSRHHAASLVSLNRQNIRLADKDSTDNSS